MTGRGRPTDRRGRTEARVPVGCDHAHTAPDAGAIGRDRDPRDGLVSVRQATAAGASRAVPARTAPVQNRLGPARIGSVRGNVRRSIAKSVSLVARAVSGASSSTRGHTRGTRARCPRARRVGRWSSIVAAGGKVHPSRPGGDAALSAPRLTSSARPGRAPQCPRGPALGRSRRWAPRPARRAGRRPATVSPPWPARASSPQHPPDPAPGAVARAAGAPAPAPVLAAPVLAAGVVAAGSS